MVQTKKFIPSIGIFLKKGYNEFRRMVFMKKNELNEVTVNYIVGGIIPLLILFPFLNQAINGLFFAFFKGNLSWLESSVVLSFVVFTFISIVFESGVVKIKKQKISNACFGIYYYNYFAAIYSLFQVPFLLLMFNIPLGISIVIAAMVCLIFVLVQKKLEKCVPKK